MTTILTFLSGKKTYILVAAGLIIQGLNMLGYLDENTANSVLGMLGLGTLATLRAGVAKAIAPPDAPPAP